MFLLRYCNTILVILCHNIAMVINKPLLLFDEVEDALITEAPIITTPTIIKEPAVLLKGANELATPKSSAESEKKDTKKRKKAAYIAPTIPGKAMLYSKQYYSMAEITAMFGVNYALIRFWGNEFDALKPMKNKKGDRHFSPEDVETLTLIYQLVKEKKYTIAGAKAFMQKENIAGKALQIVQKLESLQQFLYTLQKEIEPKK